MRNLFTSLAAGLVAFGCLLNLKAEPIEFIYSGDASGYLNGNIFSGVPFDYVLYGDTSNLTYAAPGIPILPISETTFNFAGEGSGGTIYAGTGISVTEFDNQNGSFGGWTIQYPYFPGAQKEVDLGPSPVFATYNLASSLGPVPVTFLNQPFATGDNFYTDSGTISLLEANLTTFQATVPDGGITLGFLAASLCALRGAAAMLHAKQTPSAMRGSPISNFGGLAVGKAEVT